LKGKQTHKRMIRSIEINLLTRPGLVNVDELLLNFHVLMMLWNTR